MCGNSGNFLDKSEKMLHNVPVIVINQSQVYAGGNSYGI